MRAGADTLTQDGVVAAVAPAPAHWTTGAQLYGRSLPLLRVIIVCKSECLLHMPVAT